MELEQTRRDETQAEIGGAAAEAFINAQSEDADAAARAQLGERQRAVDIGERGSERCERIAEVQRSAKTVKSAPRTSKSASATGPILPASVKSKVEQYLKKNCFASAAASHLSVRPLLRPR